jgi:PAS domain S-box-containing protein
MAVGLARVGVHQAPPAAPSVADFSAGFLSRVATPASFDVLFDYLPDVLFFVKDRDGRFTRVSRGFVRLVGADSEANVLGACDADFFPGNLAEAYARDDQQVMSLGEAIVDKVELIRNADGEVDWCRTTKLPLFDDVGGTIGLCGIMRDIKRIDVNNAAFLFWTPVVEVMLNEYASALEMSALAQRVGLSISQFNRAFRKRFGTTPYVYLTNIRLNAACQLLVATDLSMAQIALRTGFYDQSHFTNRFARRHGVPPSQYRAAHARPIINRVAQLQVRARTSSNELSDGYMHEAGVRS